MFSSCGAEWPLMPITSEQPVLVQCKANGMVSQKLEFKIVGKNNFEICRKITVAVIYPTWKSNIGSIEILKVLKVLKKLKVMKVLNVLAVLQYKIAAKT